MQYIDPMLAKVGSLPANGDEYGYEIKWDGYRCILYLDYGNFKAISRNLKDMSSQTIEIHELAQIYKNHSLIIDGELVAFSKEGKPAFELLQRRMAATSPQTIKNLSQKIPLTFIAFDLLFLDGKHSMDLPYTERRELLTSLSFNGSFWRTSPYWVNTPELLEKSRELRLEGIVIKRLDSKYEPGKRSGSWTKIKNSLRTNQVIGGYFPSKNGIGAILVGYYPITSDATIKINKEQKLIYSGTVEFGFTKQVSKKFREILELIEIADNPFLTSIKHKHPRYVKPVIVVEIEAMCWTAAGSLRFPVFKGLSNMAPHQIVKELQ